MFTELLNRLLYLARRSRFDAELDNEMQFHLETRAAELEAEGLGREDAMARARREFGPAARAREDVRFAWQISSLEDLASDLRYAARALRRNPAFAATAIACLALGIGANTTVFSIASEMLFSRPSVRDPQSLAAVRVGGNSSAPMDIYQFLRDARIFDGLAGEDEESQANWRTGEVTIQLFTIQVTDNFFAVTGIPVALGRPPRPGEKDAVVLSYGLWQRMGGGPDAIGRKMILDGRLYMIAGVLPRDHRTLFGFGFAPDLYMPISGEATYVSLYARLPAGMTRPVARTRLEGACRVFDGPNPPARHQWARDISVSAVSGIDRIRTDSALETIAAFFAMLIVVVGLVLLIACANVASLLLARAASRNHELAVRLSIGAGRGRLMRQLLTESLLLAVCGTSAGLALNVALTTAVSRIRLMLPVPIQLRIEPDWRLLAYSIALALASCLAAGLIPALKTTGAVISAALKREERQVSGRWTLRNGLVVGQLAVSIVLLCTGLLFIRNLVRASTTDPGFDIHHTVWAAMRLVPGGNDPARIDAITATAVERLRALPGVDSAALVRVVPLNDNMTIGMPVHTDLLPEPLHVMFRYNNVGPDYFRVMQIPILRGREFLPSDRAGAPPVAIINENMARRLFGDIDPIGHLITWEGPSARIVGVAQNSKYFTLGERNMSAYYAPYNQWQRPLHHSSARPDLNFLIRAAGRPEPLIAPVNVVLGRLDATAAIETRPMSQALVFALLPSRFGAAIAGSVGLLGLALAAIGLFGVLLYSVSRRIREIGLRVALGAAPRNVLLLVLRQSVALATVGLSVGLALAVFAVRPLAMFLTPDIRTDDPANFAVVAAILFGVAVAATIGPVLRALQIDPIAALRHE